MEQHLPVLQTTNSASPWRNAAFTGTVNVLNIKNIPKGYGNHEIRLCQQSKSTTMLNNTFHVLSSPSPNFYFSKS